MSTVIDEIEKERTRQREKYSFSHDDSHRRAELAYAASALAIPDKVVVIERSGLAVSFSKWHLYPLGWNGRIRDRRQELIVSAAFSVAEVERLDRDS